MKKVAMLQPLSVCAAPGSKFSWLVPWQEGDYTVAQLRAAFAGHGLVEDAVLRDSKKKKKCTALVVMATQEGAASAASSACGDLANPVLVKPFDKVRVTWGASS